MAEINGWKIESRFTVWKAEGSEQYLVKDEAHDMAHLRTANNRVIISNPNYQVIIDEEKKTITISRP